jgi:predicted deacylase
MLHSKVRDGSLREAARKRKIPILLFEGGEALRFNEDVIRIGVKGCISVMEKIGLTAKSAASKRHIQSTVARDSHWIRAPHSGSFRLLKKLGSHIKKGEELAVISDPFGKNSVKVTAVENGIIIGMSTIPLVNKGDAMFNVATFTEPKKVRRSLELLEGNYT